VLAPAIEYLANFISSGSPKQVEVALFRNFNLLGDAAKKRASEVKSKLESMRTLCDRISQSNATLVCPDSNNFGNCPAALAYYSRDSQEFGFCPTFFQEVEESKLYIFIHEVVHATTENVTDRGYSDQRIFTRLPPDEALKNAESFARFAMELYDTLRRISPITTEEANQIGYKDFSKFEFPQDNYTECIAPQRSELVSAVALAEKYNTDALTVFSIPELRKQYADILSMNSSKIVYDKGKPTLEPEKLPLREQDYQPLFKGAQQILSESLKFHCLQPGAEECAGGYLRYKDNIFFFCPSKQEPKDVESLILTILQLVYERVDNPGNFKTFIAARLAPQLSQALHTNEASPTPLETTFPLVPGMPTRETFDFIGWGTENDVTMAQWKQKLQPTDGIFKNLFVKEEDPENFPHINTCCTSNDLCFKKISGGR
jgi:hypothetical protein